MTDHYTVLRIRRTATLAEIKEAYRARAKETYPSGDSTRSEEFLRVKRAYDVLRDEAKRAAYDLKLPRTELIIVQQESDAEHERELEQTRPTDAGIEWPRYQPPPPRPQPTPINRPAGRTSPSKPIPPMASWSEEDKAKTGSAYHVWISLKQAYQGVKVELSKRKYVTCSYCGGKRFKLENGPKCPICNGSGSAGKRNFITALVFGDPCENCQGLGSIQVPRDCYCQDGKSVEYEKEIVDLPRGIADGAVVPASQGESLLVQVQEWSWREDEFTGFVRDGDDLLFTADVTKTQLRKGHSFYLETISGQVREIKVPAGSSEHYEVTMARCGMPKKGGSDFGDLHVRLRVRTRKGASTAL